MQFDEYLSSAIAEDQDLSDYPFVAMSQLNLGSSDPSPGDHPSADSDRSSLSSGSVYSYEASTHDPGNGFFGCDID